MKNMIRMIVVIVSLICLFATMTQGQSIEAASESLNRALTDIEQNKIPLKIFPPSYFDWLGGIVEGKADGNKEKKSQILNSPPMAMMQGSSQPRYYHVIDLGTLGGTSSTAYGINNKGEVVGYSLKANGLPHAFIYSQGLMREFVPSSPVYSYAYDISDSGQIVGNLPFSGTPPRAFIYTAENLLNLGTLAAPYNYSSYAYAISSAGHIVGSSSVNGHFGFRAFVYWNGTMQNIGSFGGDSVALGVNSLAQIVGYSYKNTPSLIKKPFLYHNGIMQDISPSADDFGEANAINEIGQIVGTINISQQGNLAFLYDGGTMQTLGTLGGSISSATGINFSGDIVGYSSTGGPNTIRAFIYSGGTMRNLNEYLIDANFVLTLQYAYAVNDVGQIVGSGINSSGQTHAFLLNPVPDGLEEMATNTLVEIQYGTIVRQTGKTNLIFVTHGAIPPGVNITESTAWVGDMTNLITQYLATNNLTDWQVVGYKWEEKAKYGIRLAQTSLNRGKDEGKILGSQISTQGWSHIHLIAHSAGAGLIQKITDVIKLNPTNVTSVHSTFLDPFLGFNKKGKTEYGVGADWSEHYFARDWVPLTKGIVQHSYNVDVTLLDTNKVVVDTWTSSGELISCNDTKTSHSWPIDFYSHSLFPNENTNYNGFGFLLSKEGGGWEFAVSTYEEGNNPAHVLGDSTSECSLPQIDTPVNLSPVTDPIENPIAVSPTGTVQTSQNGFVAYSGSPVWIAALVTPTNDINFVSFETRFLSVSGSRGIISVYWNTNLIGTIDERVVSSELHHHSFPFPRTQGSLSHMLGFRLDPFTSTQSSILVTNVTTGLFGPTQPFSLSQTTNSSNGLRVWELRGQLGYEYIVEATTNLVDWQSITTLLNTNGSVRFIDPGSTNLYQRFYRAVVTD